MANVVIVGAAGGIGRALAQEYGKRGWNVGLFGRDAAGTQAVSEQLQQQYPARQFPAEGCDLRDTAAVPVAFNALLGVLGTIDLVIYAAGVMKPDHVSDKPDFAAQHEMLYVNTVAAVQVLGLAAEHMQQAGRGHIAAVGSIAGERGRKGNPAYGASKAALHTYLEGLRNQLHSQSIRVSTIKPGFVKTRMLAGKSAAGAITPEHAAERIATALARGTESFFVPSWWSVVALAVRVCPSFVFKRFGPA